ncbi:HtaA domain-containing protein [Sinomonas sp. G460-2]|uniref:HtaA domain-containing protein n=1 Tax=Sinomonas sp. G460-2 TaxID=3393464 RepID=UPI0039F1116F
MKLIWPIRRSFVGYVRGSEGTVALGDGAEETEEGFVFQGIPRSSLAFVGSVHFQAHGGMLDVLIGDPAFAIDGEVGTLSITTGPGAARNTIARLTGIRDGDPASGQLLLTYEGTRLLGDVYEPGSPLDPFRIEHDDA